MILDKLSVEKFRNIDKLEIIPADGLTVICGANGQGKTSLLEGIFLLTGSKSFRAAKDADIIMRGYEKAHVFGSVVSEKREIEIDVCIESAHASRKGRFAKINDVDYGRAAEIAGEFTAIVFEPNHLSLVKAGPEGRRRFLDAALCQLYPGYIKTLRRFTRALSQKNALLKKYSYIEDASGQLDAFDAELAVSGEEITKKRAEYLSIAVPTAQNYYSELCADKERMNIEFLPCTKEKPLLNLYMQARDTDIKAGFSTVGPHREDFEVTINAASAKIYGSQGQQRSVVLSLKLAEAWVSNKVSGNAPVLLLDDVLSELDETRKNYLLGHIHTWQSFVTCCDASDFNKAVGKIIEIENGEIRNH